MNKYKDKILGSMMGGAVGDALGYPVEFMGYRQIVQVFGQEGITRYELNHKGLAEISDDTQMSLFTANGVLNTFTQYACQGVLDVTPVDYIRDSYIEWYQTQTGEIDSAQPHRNWIWAVKELHALRAPGTTCMSALQQLFHHREVRNYSKGCGGVMRIAPIPLFMVNCVEDSPKRTREIVDVAMKSAGLTHKHPLGQLSAALLAYIIEKVMPLAYVTKSQLHQYLCDGIALLQELYADYQEYIDYLQELVEKAVSMAMFGEESDAEAVARLGEGWTGDEALAIALYCVVKYPDDFEKAVVAAVNHSGDSDSTGAITGNIMGALLGYEAIPDYYKENLELRWLIEELATDLATEIPVGEGMDCWDTPAQRRWIEKYVTGMGQI